jgi:hypothetical protein
MTDQHPSLSDREIKTAQVLSQLDTDRTTRKMAVWFFGVLIVLFVANSVFLLYAAFSVHGEDIAKYVSMGFDGLLGTLLIMVARNLFPGRCKDKDGTSKLINAPSRAGLPKFNAD